MKDIPQHALQQIQQHFHDVIRQRAGHLVDQHKLELPDITPLVHNLTKAWFPVPGPGMYGGFKYWLEGEGEQAKLISESWCRVVGGSGQRHEITTQGSKLVEQGFV